MKAAFIRRYGGNEVVELGELPEPQAGPGELLVEVHAASVNPVDFKIRDGLLKPILPFRFPLILGNDLSGVVQARYGFAPLFLSTAALYSLAILLTWGFFRDAEGRAPAAAADAV